MVRKALNAVFARAMRDKRQSIDHSIFLPHIALRLFLTWPPYAEFLSRSFVACTISIFSV